jgi:ribosomal protein S21
MAIIIKRRENESNERLIRRFTRRIQTSGTLLRAKKRQFHAKPKTKRARRKDALHRLGLKTKNEYLRRIGLLEEDSSPFAKRPARRR